MPTMPPFANTAARSRTRKLQQLDASEKPIDDEARIHLKLGDVYKNRAQRSLDDALREYQESLRISEELAAKYPNDKTAMRDRGAANFRIGVANKAAGNWGEAYAAFNRARLDQQTLIERFADDETLKSNLSATLIRLGDHWVRRTSFLKLWPNTGEVCNSRSRSSPTIRLRPAIVP